MIKTKQNTITDSVNASVSCCRVEAVTSIDERGQMVLPKEIRKRAQIQAGDKLGIVVWEKAGKICCITLLKMDDLSDKVKDLLSPVIEDIASGKTE